MKIQLGAVPKNASFDPKVERWADIREPGPCLIQILAIPVAAAILILLGGLLYLVWPSGSVTVSTAFIVILALMSIPVHELLHAVCMPGGLRSPNTIIGIWPARLVFYAHYQGEMSRDQFLIVFLAPFLVLSLVPIVIIILFQWPSLELAILSLLNGILASGDIIGILLIGLQIPRSAVVQNHGWRTFWKLRE
ncbi:MAG: DUF3267 domain-containing protein [Chloroflexi bacterium]|nr:DUF3267 domain-containing protein [Chloroflexota bacterium]